MLPVQVSDKLLDLLVFGLKVFLQDFKIFLQGLILLYHCSRRRPEILSIFINETVEVHALSTLCLHLSSFYIGGLTEKPLVLVV